MNAEDLVKLKHLQDDTLDSYNDGKISKQEMMNMLRWVNGMVLKYKDKDINFKIPETNEKDFWA